MADGNRRRVVYFYDPAIGKFSYGENYPLKPLRTVKTHNLVLRYRLNCEMEIQVPSPATYEEICEFHEEEYVDYLRSGAMGDGLNFNVDVDCLGLYDYCKKYTGGSIDAARSLNSKEAEIAINWAGGWGHATKAAASGFSLVNDVILGILELLKSHPRVLCIDIGVHHNHSVERFFYQNDRVMTLSFHKFGEHFYPGTGDIVEAPKGKYSLNVPLKDGIDDVNYFALFKDIVGHVMDAYQPAAVVLQCGADSLAGDKMGGFNLSVKGHGDCVDFVRTLNLPLMLLGGGGHRVQNVARCWCYETAIAIGINPEKELRTQGPDYALTIKTCNDMENKNSTAYLDKIRSKVLEQISRLQPIHSVQSAVPILEALDEEEDMDVRTIPRIWNGEIFEADVELGDPLKDKILEAVAESDTGVLNLGSIVSYVKDSMVGNVPENLKKKLEDRARNLKDKGILLKNKDGFYFPSPNPKNDSSPPIPKSKQASSSPGKVKKGKKNHGSEEWFSANQTKILRKDCQRLTHAVMERYLQGANNNKVDGAGESTSSSQGLISDGEALDMTNVIRTMGQVLSALAPKQEKKGDDDGGEGTSG